MIEEAKIVTNEDKVRAIEGMRLDMKTYFGAQARQDASNKRILNWIKWIMGTQCIVLLIGVAIVVWLLVKPVPATLMDINHIRAENENLTNRMKLFEYQKSDFIKERQAFNERKAKEDSIQTAKQIYNQKMMLTIMKQDSLNKIRIKTLNAKSIKTVNAENVNIIKK